MGVSAGRRSVVLDRQGAAGSDGDGGAGAAGAVGSVAERILTLHWSGCRGGRPDPVPGGAGVWAPGRRASGGVQVLSDSCAVGLLFGLVGPEHDGDVGAAVAVVNGAGRVELPAPVVIPVGADDLRPRLQQPTSEL